MDWFRWVMLGFSILAAIVIPLKLIKAIQRRDMWRIFDLFLDGMLFSFIAVDALMRDATHNASPAVRWLLLIAPVLVLANWYGFSQWLFNRQRKPLA